MITAEGEEKDVLPEDRVLAYRYGRDLIPINQADEDQEADTLF